MASVDSVELKVFRAAVHYKELEGEFEKYFQTNPAKVVRQQEGSPDQYIGKVEPKAPIPARFPLNHRRLSPEPAFVARLLGVGTRAGREQCAR